MHRGFKILGVSILLLAILSGLAVSAGLYESYKQSYGDKRWQIKLNQFIDAVGTSVGNLTNQIANFISWNQDFVMAVTATPAYVDADTFTLPGDRTALLTPGRRLQIDLGTDGLKPNSVGSASYGAGITTVNLQIANLTANIRAVNVVATRTGLWPQGPGIVVARDFGAAGQTAINDALTYIGSASRTLVIAPEIPGVSETWAISADLTLPANITLRVERGATLAVATAKTLTVNGEVDAGNYQIFSLTGTGRVAMAGGGHQRTVNPVWWGARGDDPTIDSTAAIQAACDSLWTSGGKILFPWGRYKITSTIYIRGGISGETEAYGVVLSGSGVTAQGSGWSTPYKGTVLVSHINDGSPAISLGYFTADGNLSVAYFCGLENLSLCGLGTASYDAIGVQVWGYRNDIRRCEIQRFTVGIDIKFQNNYVTDSMIGDYNSGLTNHGNIIGILLNTGTNAHFGNYYANSALIRGCKIQGNLVGIQVGNSADYPGGPWYCLIDSTHFNTNNGCQLAGTHANARDINIKTAGGLRITNCSFESGTYADGVEIYVGSLAPTGAYDNVTGTTIDNCWFSSDNAPCIKCDYDQGTVINNCQLNLPIVGSEKIVRTANSKGLTVTNCTQDMAKQNRTLFSGSIYPPGESDTNLIMAGDFADWTWLGNVTNSAPAGWYKSTNATVSRESDTPIANIGTYSAKVVAGDNNEVWIYQYHRLKAGVTYTLQFALKSDVAVEVRSYGLIETLNSTAGAWKFYTYQFTPTTSNRFELTWRLPPASHTGKYFQLAYIKLTEGKTIRGHTPTVDAVIFPLNFGVSQTIAVPAQGAATTAVVSQFFLQQKHKTCRLDAYFDTAYVEGNASDYCRVKFQRYNFGAWSDIATCNLTSSQKHAYATFQETDGSQGYISQESNQGGNYRVVVLLYRATAAAPTAPANGNILLQVLYDPASRRDN